MQANTVMPGSNRVNSRIGLSFAISSICLLPVARLGGLPFGHHTKFSVALVVYGLLTYLFLKKASSKRDKLLLVLAITAPVLLVYGYLHFREPLRFTRVSQPSTMAHFIGIGIAYWLNELQRPVTRVVLLTVVLTGSAWMTQTGYDYYIHYGNYQTFTGKTEEALPEGFTFRNAQGELVTESDFDGKTVVLDFWTTSCGVCFEKFPLLQQQYNKLKNDPRVALYAVNIPLQRDSLNQAIAMINQRQYTFPVLVATNEKTADLFRVKAFPTLLVIKSNRIVFRGDIQMLNSVLD